MNSNFNNIQLLIQIQIALVGIILVAGLFFLWRAICRIEDKMDFVCSQVKKISSNSQNGGGILPENPLNLSELNDATEKLLSEVFNNIPGPIHHVKINQEDDSDDDSDDDDDATFVVFTQTKETTEEKEEQEQEQENGVQIEEILEMEEVPPVVPKSEELSNPLSKTKLSKMTLDELRKLCGDRGLSTEGIKTELVNRLLGIVRD
jgi:hypothetical protein